MTGTDPAIEFQRPAGDLSDLAEVRRLIPMAYDTCNRLLSRDAPDGSSIPYSLRDPEHAYSASTNAMVAHALAVTSGLLGRVSRLGSSAGLPTPNLVVIDVSYLRSRITSCIERLFREELGARSREAKDEDLLAADTASGVAAAVLTGSGTFGRDDPFTLFWLNDLRDIVALGGAELRHLQVATESTLGRLAGYNTIPAVLVPSPGRHDGAPRTNAQVPAHPLPAARCLMLQDFCGDGVETDALGNAFAVETHRQLALSLIGDNGFDVGDLVFFLEGALLCGFRPSDTLLDEVTKTVSRAQEMNPMLTPRRPFRNSSRGTVQDFVSIEVFSCLLRIVELLDSEEQDRFFARLKPVFSRYLAYLRRSRQEVLQESYSKNIFTGWHSDHTYEEGEIHPWLTSQVLLGLHNYAAQLDRDIARHYLLTAGLVASNLERRPKNRTSTQTSEQSTGRFPLLIPSAEAQLLSEFAAGSRSEGDNGPWSGLLYGPPGTGKTTLARKLAKELDWPLITVTTSDFLLRGESGVEARAKDLFEALSAQSRSVIFFDEIDRLLLDRDSTDYINQGDMLQFMTPSMLTKLNNLREARRSIFLIGTNYADRIDPAIKRPGRIDLQLLVLPPNAHDRAAFIRPKAPSASEEWLDDATRASVGLSYAEIGASLRRTPPELGATDPAIVVDSLRAWGRAAQLDNYEARRAKYETADPPRSAPLSLVEEAAGLLALSLECGPLTLEAQRAATWLKKRLESDFHPLGLRPEAVEALRDALVTLPEPE